MASLLKGLVSKKKVRYNEDGFDLDLTYISDRVIAMGFPASGMEGIYRNSIDDVKKFFSQKHDNNFRIYNLCSEKGYDIHAFGSNVERFPFDDHNAPPFHLLMPLCSNIDKYLGSNPKHVVALHCKAGKGRTGTVICCYMLHTGLSKTAKEALQFFGNIRTQNGKGVTIPSQQRYVHYYEQALKNGFPTSNTIIVLNRIVLNTVPHFDLDGGSDPYFFISQPPKQLVKDDSYDLVQVFDSRKKFKPKHHGSKEQVVTLPAQGIINLELEGDLRFEFLDEDKLSKDDKMFVFWVNTNFFPTDKNVLVLKKFDLDKACKDKKHKAFDAEFSIEIHYEIKYMGNRTKISYVPANFGKLMPSNTTQ